MIVCQRPHEWMRARLSIGRSVCDEENGHPTQHTLDISHISPHIMTQRLPTIMRRIANQLRRQYQYVMAKETAKLAVVFVMGMLARTVVYHVSSESAPTTNAHRIDSAVYSEQHNAHMLYMADGLVVSPTTAVNAYSDVDSVMMQREWYMSPIDSIYMCPLSHIADVDGAVFDGRTERYPSAGVDVLSSDVYVYGVTLHTHTNTLTYIIEFIPYDLKRINPNRFWLTAQLGQLALGRWNDTVKSLTTVVQQQTHSCTLRYEKLDKHGGIFIDCILPAKIVQHLSWTLQPLPQPDTVYETMSYKQYGENSQVWSSASVQLYINKVSIPTHLCKRHTVANNLVLTTMSLFGNMSADRITNWLDYHLYIGANLITIRDRFGTYKHIVDMYHSRSPCQRVQWLPSPLPRRLLERGVADSGDQVTWLNVDVEMHRYSSQWLLPHDIDEFLYVSHPYTPVHLFPSTTVCTNNIMAHALNELSNTHTSNDPGSILGAVYLPSMYHHAAEQAVSADALLHHSLSPEWSLSYPLEFPYRKLQASWDRVKWIARLSGVVWAQQHMIALRSGYAEVKHRYAPVLHSDDAASVLSIWPRPSDMLRNNHFADAQYDIQRVYEVKRLPHMNSTIDLTMLPLLTYVQSYGKTLRASS